MPMFYSRRLGRRSAKVSRASHLECRAAVGGANNQLAEAKDAERLQPRGILYTPDYVVNVGGAMFLLGVETRGWTQERVEMEVVESVRRALRQVSGLAASGRSEKWVLDFWTIWDYNDHRTGSAMQQHPEHDQADAHGLTVAIIVQ